MTGDKQGWFVPVDHHPDARTRLYVFPHAGAGPAAAAPLAERLPPDIDVWALNLPGRQVRPGEPARTDLTGLTRDLARWLVDNDVKPYALFGYCGGALLAYLAAARCAPTRLFVGSFAAPDIALIARRLHLLPRDRFWEIILDQGGIGPELAGQLELRGVFEPALRADFGLYAGYQHRPQRLTVPITVLHGRDDDQLGRGALLGWRRHTSGPVELVDLPGGHWLLDEAAAELADRLADALLGVAR
jgi:medium-chain acyl-[acyl-carrier-protein] hydrolase